MDTIEQLLAQSLDRNLAITANAGSGKTRVLVQRYVNILLDTSLHVTKDSGYGTRCNPRQIVAITFTRKAAAEMLAKVVRKIEEEYSQAKTREKLEKLKKIREDLTYARVSTIHSFCTSLLRDFPIEANVIPNFTELSEAELLVMKRNNIISVLEEWLEDKNPERRNNAQTLFRLLGRKNIENYIFRLLSKPDLLPYLYDFYSKPDQEILEIRNKYFSEIFLNRIVRGLYELNEVIAFINPSVFKPADKTNFFHGVTLLDSLCKRAVSLSESDLSEVSNFVILVNEVVNLFFTDDHLRKVYAKGFDSADLIARTDAITKFFEKSDSLSEVLQYEQNDPDLIALTRILLEITFDVQAAYNDEKSIAGGLDFEDMLMLTLELLNNERVRKQVRSRIKFLLVDEFQDTNHVQYEIIKRLVPELEIPETDDGSINVFIVGDAKQSIYGFRNADVRVFDQARRDIRALNLLNIEKGLISEIYKTPDGFKNVKTENEKQGDLSLTATFRLMPVPASCVNIVCGKTMNERESDFDVEYTPLVCSRNVEDLLTFDETQPINGSSVSFGSVSVLLTEIMKKKESDDDGDFEAGITEAELLARHIRYIIDNKEGYKVTERDGSVRKARFGDIAVLARKRNGFAELTGALLKYKIPYIIHSGTGFYETLEINDIISFLNFLHNQNDNLSLAAILRSPFLGITDTELYLISNQTGCNTLWEKFVKYSNNTSKSNDESSAFLTKESYAETNNILRAYNLLTELITIAPRVSISQLIMMIIDKSGWYGTIAGTPGKIQIEANIEKLLQHARDFENKGFRSLFDYVEELNFIAESSLNESEAVYLTGEDAVNIMTIHAAKGLEFPIVALFKTNETTRRAGTFNFSRELGIAFPLPVTIDNIFYNSIQTPLYLLSSRKQALVEKAEEKRILYVAMTRAMDHLIISASYFSNQKKLQGLFNLICSGLGADLKSLSTIDHMSISDNLSVLKGEEVINKPFNYNINIIKRINEDTLATVNPGTENFLPALLLDDIAPVIENDVFSATRLTTFDSGFNEYIQKYLLGFPQEESPNAIQTDLHDIDDEGLTGTKPGILIHKVLEDIKLWLDKSGNINIEELQKIIDSAFEIEGIDPVQELRERVHHECIAVASTYLLKSVSQKIDEFESEMELYLPVGQHFLTGKIDMLAFNETGDREIWDWKTNLVPSLEAIEGYLKHYELQMKIYAYFLSLMFKEQSTFTARLLFTRLASSDANENLWTRKYIWNRDQLERFGYELENKIIEVRNKTYGIMDM